jgi:hypothetical protein
VSNKTPAKPFLDDNTFAVAQPAVAAKVTPR